MLSHIVQTLDQRVENKPIAGAIGPGGCKVVVLLGHDTNLAGTASLLGLHWLLDGRSDDTPPGTELLFELWQDARGDYSVSVTVAMQTLGQLRNLAPLTMATPPAHLRLAPMACGTGRCSWWQFQQIAGSAIDADSVFPMATQ